MLQVNDPANNKPDEPRARVFISCGQSKQTDEVETASAIAARLRELGFDPYIAVQEQTLRGLKENIFEQLGKSEYFVFVDFKREQLPKSDPPVYRGSLFSHQELAIASYLDIEALIFQESGVKQDDGIMRFIQGNATSFQDRHLLPNVIADEIGQRGWNPLWRNDLLLERAPAQFTDAFNVQIKRQGRYFHIGVRNRHRYKSATNCCVYLEKASKVDPPTEIPINPIELKWAGYVWPSAHIPPHTVRLFDAFWILHDLPTRLQFNVFSDFTGYIPQIEGEGRYEFTYLAVADNLPPVRGSFVLDLNASIERTTLTTASTTPITTPQQKQELLESIPIVVGREDDGRWWADIESMPGVMAYGDTREAAFAAVRALAFRVAADCIDHGEDLPAPFAGVFSVA